MTMSRAQSLLCKPLLKSTVHDRGIHCGNWLFPFNLISAREIMTRWHSRRGRKFSFVSNLSTRLTRPTRVAVCYDNFLSIKVGENDNSARFEALGFAKSERFDDDDDFYRHNMTFDSGDKSVVFKMCETLRDMEIPFSDHRTGGADYFLEHFREQGFVTGKFKRFRKLGLDWDEDAPFVIEDF
ncbi:hypothetical protein [Rhizobium sp. TH2]|uniref:hypothetical protein n=1 Tax=Rhizobium sp. TH2 TaxID=2775403 RepID=UPI00215894B8|nr:hypothetical protein [Rhizobium sp. TH2]